MQPVTCPHCKTRQEVSPDNIEFYVDGSTEWFFDEKTTDKDRMELNTLEFICINCQEIFQAKAVDVIKPSDESTSNKELDDFSRQQLSHVLRYLARSGYKLNAVDDPNRFHAVNLESVDINGSVHGGLITFSSLWTSSDYSAQHYNKYLTWVNTLNLNSLGVQFCINQVGSLSMQLCYFGEYDADAFDLFHQVWKKDIDLVWSSEAREYFLE